MRAKQVDQDMRTDIYTGLVMPTLNIVRPSAGSTATSAVSNAGRLLPRSLPGVQRANTDSLTHSHTVHCGAVTFCTFWCSI